LEFLNTINELIRKDKHKNTASLIDFATLIFQQINDTMFRVEEIIKYK